MRIGYIAYSKFVDWTILFPEALEALRSTMVPEARAKARPAMPIFLSICMMNCYAQSTAHQMTVALYRNKTCLEYGLYR